MEDRHASARRARGASQLVWILVLALTGLLPLAGSSGDDLELLLWLALWALPAGALCARSPALPASLPLLSWALTLHFLTQERPSSAAPLAGMGLAGFEWVIGSFGLGRLLARRLDPVRVALASLLATLSLALAPSLGGLLGPAPWPPSVSARLLDLSPTCWVAETRGLDWLRDERVYEPVGSSSIGPDLRTPWSGALAGWGLLLLGCASLILTRGAQSARSEST